MSVQIVWDGDEILEISPINGIPYQLVPKFLRNGHIGAVDMLSYFDIADDATKKHGILVMQEAAKQILGAVVIELGRESRGNDKWLLHSKNIKRGAVLSQGNPVSHSGNHIKFSPGDGGDIVITMRSPRRLIGLSEQKEELRATFEAAFDSAVQMVETWQNALRQAQAARIARVLEKHSATFPEGTNMREVYAELTEAVLPTIGHGAIRGGRGGHG